MKSQVEKLDGLKHRLNIEVPQDVVNAALEKMYKEVQRVAKFKGFRPGKAPLTLVKTEYKAKVESDVATQIVQDHYAKALDEHSLDPVNYPEIEFDGLTEGEALKFSATFEVRPDVQLKKYEGLSVEKEKLEVNPAMISTILEDIRKSKATMVPVIELRAAQNGDVAVIDFQGKVGGQELPNGSGKEFLLELGSNQFIPGFEEGVVGMEPGQKKTLNLKFPDDYGKGQQEGNGTSIAGKEVEFEVTLLELKKKVLPELNDDFAKTIGTHESLEDLKKEISTDINSREEKRVKDDLKNRILHSLVDANNFQVPNSMIQEQKKILIEDVHKRMESQGMTHDQFHEYSAKWDKDFDKSAEFVIRSSLLINSIAKKEKLFSTEEDFQKKLEDYAKQSGIEIEKIKGFYSKPENKSRLNFQMTEEKVMNLLIEKANVTELPKDKLKPLPEEV
jgi:trigger factor